MATDDVFQATIDTIEAAGLEVTIIIGDGGACVTITDKSNGHRYIHRDIDALAALCNAATAAGFEFTDDG